MKIELNIECGASELILIAAALESVEEVLGEAQAEKIVEEACDLVGATGGVDPVDVTVKDEEVDESTAAAREIVEAMFAPEDVAEMKARTEKKKRGRPAKKKQPEEVLAALKESVAAMPPMKDNVVPLKKPDPLEDAVFDTPTPAVPGDIATGQQLQEYILGLVHQKRLDPTAVKAKVYPKYNVIRSLDLSPDQVPLAKADVDAMLKGAEPKKASDLDL